MEFSTGTQCDPALDPAIHVRSDDLVLLELIEFYLALDGEADFDPSVYPDPTPIVMPDFDPASSLIFIISSKTLSKKAGNQKSSPWVFLSAVFAF